MILLLPLVPWVLGILVAWALCLAARGGEAQGPLVQAQAPGAEPGERPSLGAVPAEEREVA